MYVRDNVVSAKCFSGKCNFWKVFFGKVYRIQICLLMYQMLNCYEKQIESDLTKTIQEVCLRLHEIHTALDGIKRFFEVQ